MKSKHLLALLSIFVVVSCGLWLSGRRGTPAVPEPKPAWTEGARGGDAAAPAATATAAVAATVTPAVGATFNSPEPRPEPDAVREPTRHERGEEPRGEVEPDRKREMES